MTYSFSLCTCIHVPAASGRPHGRPSHERPTTASQLLRWHEARVSAEGSRSSQTLPKDMPKTWTLKFDQMRASHYRSRAHLSSHDEPFLFLGGGPERERLHLVVLCPVRSIRDVVEVPRSWQQCPVSRMGDLKQWPWIIPWGLHSTRPFLTTWNNSLLLPLSCPIQRFLLSRLLPRCPF